MIIIVTFDYDYECHEHGTENVAYTDTFLIIIFRLEVLLVIAST